MEQKTIYIATRHAIFNQGSILQALATQVFFKKLGFDSKIIDYVPSEERFPKIILTELKNNEKWNSNIVKRIIFVNIKFFTKLISFYKFNIYRKKYLILSKKIKSVENLKLLDNETTIMCSGSDQVWGPIINGKLCSFYFLNFSNHKKISFSSSFGRKVELPNEYLDYLRDFEFISLRDGQFVNYLDDLGLKNVFYVLDPTMMIDENYWYKFASKKIDEKHYLLYYRLHHNDTLEQEAVKFAKEHKLKLIRISNSIDHVFLSGKTFSNIDPAMFLSLIKNADCVLSDSFHCTVFSILFRKKFITICPGETSPRITDLLNRYNLNSRYAINIGDFCLNSIFDDIDYVRVFSKVHEDRELFSEKLMFLLKNI